MSEVARFLGSHPPFDDLEPERLLAIAGVARTESFPVDTVILRKRGSPARFVYMVRSGSVELLDDGQVVDVLEEGEVFGHPSLLSGRGPAYTVRAREDTTCFLLPAEVAGELFAGASGLGFLAAGLSRRIERTARAREDVVGDPRLLHAGALVSRAPVECDPETTVMEAARIMSREGCSSLLVRTDEGYGIVTDTDLRGKVVAGGLPYDSTVRDVMTFPVRTVTVDRLVHEVLLDMLDADVHHLPVVDEEGRVMGVLSDTDILGLERRDPFSLRTQILRAGGREEVVRAGLMLPACIATLARVGLDPVAVGHVLSVLVDALTTRLLELAVNRLGDPPVPWAWLALGSEARREQALGTDQDHALAYANGGEEHDPYFARLAALVVEGLEGCGIRRCPSAVLASEDPWRQSVSGWVRTFEDWMGAHAAKPVFLTHIGFDYRAIAGPLEIESVLDDTVRSAKGRPEFLWRLARLALEVKPPLGFRGGLVVASAGGREGVLDIKAGGLMPVTDLARFFALEAGVGAKGTLERLGSAAEAGIIDEETRDALRDAYQVFLETRLSHQLAQVESGRPPDNLVDPSGLGQMSRARLKDAFRIVSHVQRELSRRLSAARIR